jgi:hypothetical protein
MIRVKLGPLCPLDGPSNDTAVVSCHSKRRTLKTLPSLMKWLRYQRVISLGTQVGVTSQINNRANTEPGPAGGGIRYLGGISIHCRPVTPAVSPVP